MGRIRLLAIALISSLTLVGATQEPLESLELDESGNTSYAIAALSPTYVGVWEGSGVQNTGSEWSILISIASGSVNSVVGTIAYPSLRCGGELTLLESTEEKIELFENITYGQSSCVARGYVTLEFASSRSLNFYYYDAANRNGKYSSSGSLRKISGN